MFSKWRMDFVPSIMGAVTVGVVLVGFVRVARTHSDRGVSELYVALYFAILLGTQFALDGGERYLAPIFPFLMLYTWQGSSWLLQNVPGLRSPVRVSGLMTAMIALLLVLYLARGVQAIVHPVRDRLPDVTLGTTWLRTNTPTDAIVMAAGPREVYLYGQRKVVPFPPPSTNHAELAQRITCGQADYVLVRARMVPGVPHWDDVTAQHIVPTFDEHPSLFEQTYASPDGITRVYRIVRPESMDCEPTSLDFHQGA